MFESAGSKELDPRALMEVWHLKTTLDLLKTDFRHTHSHTHMPLLMTDFWLGLVQLRLRPLRVFFFLGPQIGLFGEPGCCSLMQNSCLSFFKRPPDFFIPESFLSRRFVTRVKIFMAA